MNKITEELLEKIKTKQPVDVALLPGYVSTPRIPDEVFTIVTKENGEEFKRYLEADKWIAWLNSVAEKNVDPEADLTEKAIAETKFYRQCELATREIDRRYTNGMSGTIWLQDGKPYSISLTGKNIDLATAALVRVCETAVVPVAEDIISREERFDDERNEAYLEIVKGSR